MGRRVDLQALLELLLEKPNVYFQPPENIRMQYPAIVYNLDDMEVVHADNLGYRRTNKYQITLIDRDPDNTVKDRIAELPLCGFSRFYVKDNLNHYVYDLFF